MPHVVVELDINNCRFTENIQLFGINHIVADTKLIRAIYRIFRLLLDWSSENCGYKKQGQKGRCYFCVLFAGRWKAV